MNIRRAGETLAPPQAFPHLPSALPSSPLSPNRPGPGPNPDQVNLSQEANRPDQGSSWPLLESLSENLSVPSYRAESRDPGATVAVFDNFEPSAEGSPSHGELAEGVVQEMGGYSEADTQRFEIGAPSGQPFEQAVASGDPDALQTLVEDSTTGLLDSTSGAMEEILRDETSRISTINQSQSVSPSKLSAQLLGRAIPARGEDGQPAQAADPEFRSALAQSVGLADDATDQQLAQAVVDAVDSTFENSQAIASSRQRYDQVSQRAADAGIGHVISSGNSGEVKEYLDSLGVKTGENFYRSALANSTTTVVAATDDKGTPTAADDTGASLNSPNAGAEIAAPGVNRQVTTGDGRRETVSGTSFSAPEVAAAMARIAAQQPHLSPQQRENLLVETATKVDGSASEIGAGAVQPEEALAAG